MHIPENPSSVVRERLKAVSDFVTSPSFFLGAMGGMYNAYSGASQQPELGISTNELAVMMGFSAAAWGTAAESIKRGLLKIIQKVDQRRKP